MIINLALPTEPWPYMYDQSQHFVDLLYQDLPPEIEIKYILYKKYLNLNKNTASLAIMNLVAPAEQ